jgi:integral membrane protein (TIGR01906 family)
MSIRQVIIDHLIKLSLTQLSSAALALAVPIVLVGNALWVLLGPWLVDVAYALPGFPDDHGGLGGEQRAALADTGMSAVRPFGGDADLLRGAELPDGREAFAPAEIRHMEDVRELIAGFLVAWAAALAVGVAAGARLYRRAGIAAVARSLRVGALGTLAAIAAIGLFALVAFDAFFTAFHGVFFEGDSWRFDDGATLRRLYPDAFWTFASAALALLAAIQAGALTTALSPLARRSARGFRRRRPSTP